MTWRDSESRKEKVNLGSPGLASKQLNFTDSSFFEEKMHYLNGCNHIILHVYVYYLNGIFTIFSSLFLDNLKYTNNFNL